MQDGGHLRVLVLHFLCRCTALGLHGSWPGGGTGMGIHRSGRHGFNAAVGVDDAFCIDANSGRCGSQLRCRPPASSTSTTAAIAAAAIAAAIGISTVTATADAAAAPPPSTRRRLCCRSHCTCAGFRYSYCGCKRS